MAADIQLEKGRWQAANNNFQNAMSHFKEAIGLDANITIDAEFAVATLISESLVDSGSRKALRGEVSAALSDLKQAKGYPIAQSNEMLYQKLIQVLMKLAQDGEINAALDLLDGVPELDLGMELPAMVWNLVCWAGSTRGNASRVLFAGEKAVQLDPDPNYYDSRGLARALTGDIPGAIEDFQVFIADCEATEQFLNLAEQRKFWINELQAGRNPFDEATLRSLR